MIDGFPWYYCSYYENRCRELLKEIDYEDHHLGCIFQKVNCPRLQCKEKIMLKDLRAHISKNQSHTGSPESQPKLNKYSITWVDALDPDPYWTPIEISFNNEIFYVEGITTKKGPRRWVTRL